MAYTLLYLGSSWIKNFIFNQGIVRMHHGLFSQSFNDRHGFFPVIFYYNTNNAEMSKLYTHIISQLCKI